MSAPSSVSSQPSAKRRKTSRGDEVEEEILKYIDEGRARRQQREENDEELFGKHVAIVLQRLPHRAWAMARLHED